ncbi:MAG: hypothetical protein AVDCRST_MAG68-4114 [uncultured Gemmatimonadetes bacterium]|uniref:Lipoprotein n=1 Tax=uncultured Gemmatimonadota bacterium TaxID=203437 RepID=A0A6J4MDF8_9BACT|nr:MAG: hypothetical protein AVDCRST_MAG68-4114 [uncultured Gemmatimonadota bacterium]
MKSPRFALALAAFGFIVAACERAPTSPSVPTSARHEDQPPPPPPEDTTGRGGGTKGSGG